MTMTMTNCMSYCSVYVFKDERTRQFLEEGTALDPRFKNKVAGHDVWARLVNELLTRQVCAISNIYSFHF